MPSAPNVVKYAGGKEKDHDLHTNKEEEGIYQGMQVPLNKPYLKNNKRWGFILYNSKTNKMQKDNQSKGKSLS